VDSVDIIQTFVLPVSVKEKKSRFIYLKNKLKIYKKLVDLLIKIQKINPKFSPLDDKVDWTLFENDFEHIVCLTYPEILNIKDMLYKSGALYSGLSGSGSTVFGIYNDIMTAKEAAELAKEANVKNLILTHFSARYSDESVLIDEAKQTHNSVIAAKDLLEIEI